MKQIEWWEKECEDKLIRYSKSKYKADHYIALFCHSFEWAFVILIPFFVKCLLYGNSTIMTEYTVLLIFNTLMHFYVDNEKANKHSISLVQDQLCHLIQILGTSILTYGII